MDAVAAADPPELIAASGIYPNGIIGEWPMKLQWSDMGCRGCCGGTKIHPRSRPMILGFFPPHHLLLKPSKLGRTPLLAAIDFDSYRLDTGINTANIQCHVHVRQEQ